MFHLTDGIRIGESGERSGILGKRSAMGGLAEAEQGVGKGACFVDGRGFTQRGPLGGLLASEFQREFPPLSGLFGEKNGTARKRFCGVVMFQGVLVRNLLEK